MQRLNKSITHAVDRPVKVMQFGEGNFLRAFVDYIFDVTNEKTDFNGGVVIVKPIEFGTLERFHDQECQYTLQLRGFVDGEPKEITRQITSVVDAVAAIEDYDILKNIFSQYLFLYTLLSVKFNYQLLFFTHY